MTLPLFNTELPLKVTEPIEEPCIENTEHPLNIPAHITLTLPYTLVRLVQPWKVLVSGIGFD